MKKRNKGKYQKQPESKIKVHIFIVATVVLAIFAASVILFYRMVEQQEAPVQVTEPLAATEIEESYWEEPETVEYQPPATTVEPTVTATEEITSVPEQPTQPPESATQTADTLEESGRTATVLLSAGELKVRSGAGTSYNEIGRLKGGDAVTVYEQKNVNGMMWGNIGYGWVSMDYVTFGADYSYTPQNQRSDYFGDWLTDNKMCYMCITQNGNGADIRVVYTISQGTDMTWSMYGEFDEHGAIRYWNGVRKDHNGGVESVKYTNGEGAIVIDGLSLSWHESAEGPGEAGRFERVYNYRPNNSTGAGNSSEQGNSGVQSGSGSDTTTEIPRRFSNDDIKQVLMKEAKIELGYRHGDSFSMDYPMVTGYNSSTGKYYAFAQGRWCGANYYINAVLQDVNGVLSVSKVLDFKVD